MKRLILIPLLLVAFAVSVMSTDKQESTAVLHSTSINLEHKESYKLDDGEYKGAVVTNSGFDNEQTATAGLFTMFVALSAFFANNKKRLTSAGLGALFIASMFVTDSMYALAILPLVPFFRSPESGDQGGEVAKLIEDMAKKNNLKITDEVKTQLTEALKGLATPDAITKQLEALGLKGDVIKVLNDAIEKQGEWMRKHESIMIGGKKNWKDNINKIFEDKDTQDSILRTFKNGAGHVDITNKVVGNITTANVTTDTGGNAILDLINADELNGMNLRDAWIENYATVTRATKPTYTYGDFIPGEGDAAFLAEGAAKSKIDLDVQSKTITPKKVAAYEIMSEEAITDIPRMQSEATNLILKRVLLKRQNKILFGDGNNDTPLGVTSQAAAFNPASWTGDKVSDVNLYDMLVAVANQIFTSHNYTDEMEYYPNLAVVNDADLNALKLKKNDLGMYLFPAFQIVGSNGKTINIDNFTVVPKRDIPTGSVLMGDFTKLRIINYVDYSLRMGFINDQFINNLFTMLGESRFFTLIKTLDKKAFVYDTYANISAGIKTL